MLPMQNERLCPMCPLWSKSVCNNWATCIKFANPPARPLFKNTLLERWWVNFQGLLFGWQSLGWKADGRCKEQSLSWVLVKKCSSVWVQAPWVNYNFFTLVNLISSERVLLSLCEVCPSPWQRRAQLWLQEKDFSAGTWELELSGE